MNSFNNDQKFYNSIDNQPGQAEDMSDHVFENLVSDLITSQFNKNPSMAVLERKPKADKGV